MDLNTLHSGKWDECFIYSGFHKVWINFPIEAFENLGVNVEIPLKDVPNYTEFNLNPANRSMTYIREKHFFERREEYVKTKN